MKTPNPNVLPEISTKKNNDKTFKRKKNTWKIGLGNFDTHTVGIIVGGKRRLEVKELMEKKFIEFENVILRSNKPTACSSGGIKEQPQLDISWWSFWNSRMNIMELQS